MTFNYTLRSKNIHREESVHLGVEARPLWLSCASVTFDIRTRRVAAQGLISICAITALSSLLAQLWRTGGPPGRAMKTLPAEIIPSGRKYNWKCAHIGNNR